MDNKKYLRNYSKYPSHCSERIQDNKIPKTINQEG